MNANWGASGRAWSRVLAATSVVVAVLGLALSVERVARSAIAPAVAPSVVDDAKNSTAIQSPFALSAPESIAEAFAASVGLVGVRIAEEADRSGAVLVLEDGTQRAFALGQEIAPGVQLAQVSSDAITLSFMGGEQRIALAGSSRRHAVARETSAAVAPGADVFFAETYAWFSSLLSRTQDADTEGWPVSGPIPTLAANAGLRSGDLILTINGMEPPVDASVLSGASQIRLAVQRADGQRVDMFLAPYSRS